MVSEFHSWEYWGRLSPVNICKWIYNQACFGVCRPYPSKKEQIMNKCRLQICLAISSLLLVTLACSFSASTANIQEAKMARDYDGNDPTTTFAQDQVFYCVVELANAPDDTVIKASWQAVDVEGAEPNTFIDETELSTGSGKVHFELSNNGLWPLGKYAVQLYLNGELDQTIEFTVQ
jgi:hypothetical protein